MEFFSNLKQSLFVNEMTEKSISFQDNDLNELNRYVIYKADFLNNAIRCFLTHLKCMQSLLKSNCTLSDCFKIYSQTKLYDKYTSFAASTHKEIYKECEVILNQIRFSCVERLKNLLDETLLFKNLLFDIFNEFNKKEKIKKEISSLLKDDNWLTVSMRNLSISESEQKQKITERKKSLKLLREHIIRLQKSLFQNFKTFDKNFDDEINSIFTDFNNFQTAFYNTISLKIALIDCSVRKKVNSDDQKKSNDFEEKITRNDIFDKNVSKIHTEKNVENSLLNDFDFFLPPNDSKKTPLENRSPLAKEKSEKYLPIADKEKIENWLFKNGTRRNIRVLLSSLEVVLWPSAVEKWRKLELSELMEKSEVKVHYRKAILIVHPDRNNNEGDEILSLAKLLFRSINESWEEFNKLI